MNRYLSILITILIIFIFIRALRSEKLDLFCPPNIKEFNCEKCDDGKGKYYYDGIGSNQDKVATLLDKIQWSSEFDDRTVKWRRCIMLAIICTFLIFLAVIGKFPNGKQLLLSVIIIFIVLYGSFSYYQWHYNKYPVFNIAKNLDIIRDRLKLKKRENKIVT